MGQSYDFSNFSLIIINDYYKLNNRTYYHGYDLIPTSEGLTRIRHGKKIRNNHSMVLLRKFLLNSLYTLPYLSFVERYKTNNFCSGNLFILKSLFSFLFILESFDIFWHMLTFPIKTFWLISGVLTFAKCVKFLKRSLLETDLSIFFLFSSLKICLI